MATVKLVDALKPKKFVVYYRVSTARQGESGLGLDAQLQAVQAHIATQQGAVILKEYREVETGKIADRPELQKAISHCKRSKAILLIAKLDRLARNVLFTATLMETDIEFVACDNPNANRLTIHILAAVAENEARMISIRTTDALAGFIANKRVPKKIRDQHPTGVPAEIEAAYAGKLGAARPGAKQLTHAHAFQGAAKAGESHAKRADEAYEGITEFLVEMKGQGLSLSQMAAKLDEEGHTTRSGKPWNKVQVMRVLERVA